MKADGIMKTGILRRIRLSFCEEPMKLFVTLISERLLFSLIHTRV